MVTYVFSVEDLARTRFAVSPLFELVRSLTALSDPSSAALHLPWLRTLSGRLTGLDLKPAVALVPPRGYSPDFLTPAPASPLGDIGEELDQLRATPAAQVRQELELFAREHKRPAPEKVTARRLADTLAEFWRRAHEPTWPRVRALLDADIAHRARRLAEGGPAALFDDLHPEVRWHGDRLEVDVAYTATVHLEGRGLVLVPSAFVWSGPMAITDAPWQPTVIYPARGIATLWEEGEPHAEGLARVIGTTRAAALSALDAPRSTTELARRLKVTPGGASQHLQALKAAGLVSARREGREVLYVRTPVADSLVGAKPST